MLGRATRARVLVGCSAAVTVAVAAMIAVATPAAAAPTQADPVLPPADIVVLVDESGSLSEEGVAKEREAARTVALSVLGPGSKISVVGFGSSDKDGQSPVDEFCRDLPLDTAAQRDAAAKCADQAVARTPDQGNNTDHLAALTQAGDILKGSSIKGKIVFLLTDGKLDVSKSPNYGDELGNPVDEQRTAAARNAAALEQLPAVLDGLAAQGVQVWPLGFGQADDAELARFARGKACAPGQPAPDRRIIANAAELADSIIKAFVSATCSAVTPFVPGSLSGGSSTTLSVEVPPIASDSAILVYKQDPRISVQYFEPGATEPVKEGESDGSVFQISGQTTGTESLRIIDPKPGTWTVKLTAAPGLPDQEVGARVVYQGAVSARLLVTPPQPAAGQTVDVTMQLRTRRGGVADPAQLTGLTFLAGLTANGTSSPPLTLTDTNADGTFEGKITVPKDASGALTFTGSVAGPGIGPDSQTFPTRVQTGAAELSAQIVLQQNGDPIAPGGVITGEARIDNSTTTPRRLRVMLTDPTPGAVITADPSVVDAPPGSSTAPFTLRFGSDSAIGGTQAVLKLVDDADPTDVIYQNQFAVDVKPPPTWLERFWWVLVIAAALLVAFLAFLAVRAKARRDRRRVRGLRVQLYKSGVLVQDLAPDRPQDEVFRFQLHDDGFTQARLLAVPPGVDPGGSVVYELRRNGAELSLTPDGPSGSALRPGEERALTAAVSVIVIDGQASGAPIEEPAFAGAGNSWDDAGSSWAGGASDSWSGEQAGSWNSPQPSAPPNPGSSWPPQPGSGGDSWSNGSDGWGASTPPAGPDRGNPPTRPTPNGNQGWGDDSSWNPPAGGGTAAPYNPDDKW